MIHQGRYAQYAMGSSQYFIRPNMAVKGTRRPSAVVKLGGLFGFTWLLFSPVKGAPLTFTLGLVASHGASSQTEERTRA